MLTSPSNVIALVALFLSFQLSAKEVPSLTAPIVDQAGIVSTRTKAQLDRSLRQLKKRTGIQLQVLTVDSLEGESIEGYSMKVADAWQLGNERDDRGLLFLIAFKDRKMRIEVGQGLEGTITDLDAGRIIDQVTPLFKRQEYELGILFGLNLMAKKLGEDQLLGFSNPQSLQQIDSKKRPTKYSLARSGIYILIFLFLIFFSGRGRGLLWMGGSYYSRGSWSGGGSSFGGGGWSGGGGGFSGGGASGSW